VGVQSNPSIKGETKMAINEEVTGDDSVAITGTAQGGNTLGIKGVGDATGVQGVGKGWHGVEGISDSTVGGFGVHGVHRTGGTGVVGESTGWIAVGGFAAATSQGAAIYGEHMGGQAGVWGNNRSETDPAGAGVVGTSRAAGVVGESSAWMGVYGLSKSTIGGAGVMGESVGTGAGIYGKGGRVAGFFEGDVEVTGDIRLLNADCAEDFDIAEADLVEPGTVMVLGEEGVLYPSQQAYDKRVAGVISGAGDYKPGLILDKQQSRSNRKPIALLGKVYCKVDASYAPIEVGDLLTTSDIPGRAMKVTDPLKAFGAVIGKALRPLKEGHGLIPILIALQ
jgi:hypothetical protein